MRRIYVVAALAAALALVGCSGNSAKEAKGDTSATKVKQVSDGDISEYFKAIASADPARMEAARKFTVPGSIAEGYILHQAYTLNASIDGGSPDPAEKLTKKKNGYESCGTDDDPDDGVSPCVLWGNVETKKGRIASLTVNGKSLKNRLSVGDGSKVDAEPYGIVEFLSAYKSVQSNALFVSLRVATGGTAAVSDFSSAQYRSPQGRQSEAAQATGPDSQILPNSKVYVSIAFPGVDPGGEVHLTMTNTDYGGEREVVIKTR
ncbi:MAG: hypothetical protein ACJ71Z_13245 [Aeromicrobium sp.]